MSFLEVRIQRILTGRAGRRHQNPAMLHPLTPVYERPMASIPPLAREAIEHARRRDYDTALDKAREALEDHRDDVGLQLFVGLLHARRMEFDEALPHLHSAVQLAPTDSVARLELARALMAVGELDKAEQIVSQPGLPQRDAQMLGATIKARKGDSDGAIQAFHRLVERDPNDFENWTNLGVTLLNAGNPHGATEALGRSLELRPDRPRVIDKWAEAQVAADTGEQALVGIRKQLADRPNDVLLRVSAARLEDLLRRPENSVDDLKQALEFDPSNVAALCALADLYERQNEVDKFSDIVDRLQQVAPHSESLPLLRASVELRRGNPEEALAFAHSASPVTDPGSRAELIGRICDRLGRTEEAWEAYSIMNREDARAVVRAAAEAANSRTDLENQLKTMTVDWGKDWTDVEKADNEPAFLVGFPRSGTTLLDTFLMGHPELYVSEENRMLQTVSDAERDLRKFPNMPAADVEKLRALYFAEASKCMPDWPGHRLVDKLPFALVAGPHIHRLFAGAPIIFVERHPCDVVLSCYFNRFLPSGPAANFVDLENTAKLYDVMMRYWFYTRDLLGLRVHPVRYERMVQDTEAELRPVADFLGLEWSDDLIASHETAAKRGFIKTPSYAQVAQPVYKSSVARWTRYRSHFEAVLPILEPWVRHFGYEL